MFVIENNCVATHPVVTTLKLKVPKVTGVPDTVYTPVPASKSKTRLSGKLSGSIPVAPPPIVNVIGSILPL